MATSDVIREASLYLEDFLKELSECGVVGSYNIQFLETRDSKPQLVTPVQQLVTNMKSLLLKLDESLRPTHHAEAQTDEISDCSLCKCQDSLKTPAKAPSTGESEGESEPSTREKAFKLPGLLHPFSSSPPHPPQQEVTSAPESVFSHCPGAAARVNSNIDDKYAKEGPDTEGLIDFVCTRKPAEPLPLASKVLSRTPRSKHSTEQAEIEAAKKLVNIFRTKAVNTVERLSAVIEVIYEKAVNEESLLGVCSTMCQALSLMSVPGSGKELHFRNLLINKAQKEFERDDYRDFVTEKLKEIEECTDLGKRQELQAELTDSETTWRNRRFGNIKFVGELYKQRMLTSPIMMRIIGTLLAGGEMESLECLCELLTRIGKILEVQCAQQAKEKSELDKYFKMMEEIVQDDQTAASVRSLMMGVINLRQNNWLPRREDEKPETEAQVQKAKIETFEQQILQLTRFWQREDGHGRSPKKDRSSQKSNENWRNVASNRRRAFGSSQLRPFTRQDHHNFTAAHSHVPQLG